jgi:hypothetical protein
MDGKGKKYNLMLRKGQFGRKCKLFFGAEITGMLTGLNWFGLEVCSKLIS